MDTHQPVAPPPPPLAWPEGGVTRVPFQVFSDPEIYAMEQQKIFRGPVWHYLCLEAEIPNKGDIRTTWVGDTPIIVTRDEDGQVHAMINRCAHKGALVCLKQLRPRHILVRLVAACTLSVKDGFTCCNILCG